MDNTREAVDELPAIKEIVGSIGMDIDLFSHHFSSSVIACKLIDFLPSSDHYYFITLVRLLTTHLTNILNAKVKMDGYMFVKDFRLNT